MGCEEGRTHAFAPFIWCVGVGSCPIIDTWLEHYVDSLLFKTGARQNRMVQLRRICHIWMRFGNTGFETGATEDHF